MECHMLILSRKPGQQCRIGGDITITILRIQGGQVRIGITAPKEIGVHREEIYQRICLEETPITDEDATTKALNLQ